MLLRRDGHRCVGHAKRRATSLDTWGSGSILASRASSSDTPARDTTVAFATTRSQRFGQHALGSIEQGCKGAGSIRYSIGHAAY